MIGKILTNLFQSINHTVVSQRRTWSIFVSQSNKPYASSRLRSAASIVLPIFSRIETPVFMRRCKCLDFSLNWYYNLRRSLIADLTMCFMTDALNVHRATPFPLDRLRPLGKVLQNYAAGARSIIVVTDASARSDDLIEAVAGRYQVFVITFSIVFISISRLICSCKRNLNFGDEPGLTF